MGRSNLNLICLEFGSSHRCAKLLKPFQLIALFAAWLSTSGCFEEEASTSPVATGKPRISAVLPKSGTTSGGITVTLTGENLGTAVSVAFGTADCTELTIHSSKKTTCVTPAGAAGSVDVMMTFQSGDTSTLSSAYQYQEAAPSLSTLQPSRGGVNGGTILTLTGSNFDGTGSVTFNGVAATGLELLSTTQLRVVSPAGTAGSATIRLTQGDGQFSSLSSAFVYEGDPTLTSASPSSGSVSGGGILSLVGSGFLEGASVTVGGNSCGTVSVASSSQLSCTLPASSSTGVKDIVVSTSSTQSATLAGAYTYYQALSITPAQKTSTVSISGCTACSTVTYSGSGGVPPYTYSIYSSALAHNSLAATSHTINSSTGVYTLAGALTVSLSPPTGVATIRATDTVGNTADTQIYLVAPVTLTSPAFEIGPTTTTGTTTPALSRMTLTVSNGVSPYAYSLSAGTGTFEGSSSNGLSTYTAPTYPVASDASVTLMVTDADGRTSSVGLSLRGPARFTALYKAANGSQATARVASDAFGKAVAMSDQYLVVGAPDNSKNHYNDADAENAGAAYIYRRVSTVSPPVWEFEQKIRGAGSDGTGYNGSVASDNFGSAVAISGDLIAVGAPNQSYDANGGSVTANAGAAYVFARTSSTCSTVCWSLEQKIVPTGTAARVAGDQFGSSLALSGNLLVVGAPFQDTDESGSSSIANAGAAFVFNRNSGNWTQTQKLVAQGLNARIASDLYGSSVATDGTTILIGAPGQSYGSTGAATAASAGAVFAYALSSGVWSQSSKWVAATPTAAANFGASVGVSGGIAVSGAPGDTVGGNAEAGSVGVFSLNSGNVWTISSTIYSSLSYTSGTSDGAASARYGNSVALSGDYLAVGSPGQSTDYAGANTSAGAGAIYVYKRASSTSAVWNHRGKFTGVGTNGRLASDALGTSVGVTSSGLSCGGSPDQDYDSSGANAAAGAGAAWVFY
jgi:hypothetical protein